MSAKLPATLDPNDDAPELTEEILRRAKHFVNGKPATFEEAGAELHRRLALAQPEHRASSASAT